MLAAVPLVRRAVCDVAVADYPVVGKAIHRLQFAYEAPYRGDLNGRHGLVVVAYALYPDGELVDILLAVPHRPPRVESLPVAIHDCVDRAVFRNAVMSLPAVGKLVERASGGGLRSVEDYELCRAAHLSLRVSRRPVSAGSVNCGTSQCGHGRKDGDRHPHRPSPHPPGTIVGKCAGLSDRRPSCSGRRAGLSKSRA